MGAGQNAEVVHYYFTSAAHASVVGFVVDQEFLTEETLFGLPVVDPEAAQLIWPPHKVAAFCAFSSRNQNRDRFEGVQRLRSWGYSLSSFVHPSAHVHSGFVLNENVLILENNILQFGSSVGHNTFIWSSNHIGHHTRIGENVFIASEVVVSGDVAIGDFTFLGVNSTVTDGVNVAEATFVSAMGLVSRDTQPGERVRPIGR